MKSFVNNSSVQCDGTSLHERPSSMLSKIVKS